MEQLTEKIKETAAAVIKDFAPSAVQSAVEKAMEKALAPSKEIEGLTAAQADTKKAIEALQSAMNGKSALSSKKREREKGEAFGTIIRHLNRNRNNVESTAKTLEKEGHGDLAEMVKEQSVWVETKTDSMQATNPETGGVLIPQPVSQEVIDILRARVTVTALGPIMMPMPSGNYRLPKVTQSVTGSYVGESTSPSVEQVKTGSALLSYKKLMTTVPASNDLFRFSNPGADQLIRNQVVNGLAVRKDQAFLRGDGTNGVPKGLRYQCKDTNLMSGAGTNGIALYATTIGGLINLLVSGNAPMAKCAWIMSPRTYMSMFMVRATTGDFILRDEMSRGTLFGYPFKVSTSIPETLTDGGGTTETELYFCDFGDVVVGESQSLIVDASTQAAYEDGATVKAAFSRDETVIRAIDEHDLVVTRDACLAIANKVSWVMA
jgi:HK97 family phage major capsid protein